MLMGAKIWSGRLKRPRSAVIQDAEQLIRRWGEAAYDAAEQMSFREDMGLISTPAAGHWSRVKGEIGQKLGLNGHERRADFAAGAGSRHYGSSADHSV